MMKSQCTVDCRTCLDRTLANVSNAIQIQVAVNRKIKTCMSWLSTHLGSRMFVQSFPLENCLLLAHHPLSSLVVRKNDKDSSSYPGPSPSCTHCRGEAKTDKKNDIYSYSSSSQKCFSYLSSQWLEFYVCVWGLSLWGWLFSIYW